VPERISSGSALSLPDKVLTSEKDGGPTQIF
jgi:hypothetical protein